MRGPRLMPRSLGLVCLGAMCANTWAQPVPAPASLSHPGAAPAASTAPDAKAPTGGERPSLGLPRDALYSMRLAHRLQRHIEWGAYAGSGARVKVRLTRTGAVVGYTGELAQPSGDAAIDAQILKAVSALELAAPKDRALHTQIMSEGVIVTLQPPKTPASKNSAPEKRR